MVSTNTNAAALTALRTLQATSKQLDATQNRISTGYKIGEAKDNAAYWAISTTLKSDNKSLATVKDALGLGSATVDTAYQGLNKAKDVLDEIKSKLTAATQDGVDRNKIQSEISELQKQLQSIATSSTFASENWLSVDSSAGGYSSNKTVVASFNRLANGAVSIGTIGINTTNVSLYDTNVAANKDGILDTSVVLSGVSVGGSNSTLGATAGGLTAASAVSGAATGAATTKFNTGGAAAVVFDNAADKITLSVTLNGNAAVNVEIRRGTVQTALNNSANSVTVSTGADMVKIINQAFADSGVTGVTASLSASGMIQYTNTATGAAATNNVAVTATAVEGDTNGTLGGTGVKFLNTDFNSAAATYAKSSVEMNAFVGPIQFVDAVNDKIKFSINVDGGGAAAVEITKATVSRALGTTDGKINSAAEFQQVIIAALGDPNNDGTLTDAITGVTVGSILSGKVTFTSKTTGDDNAVAVSAVSTEGFTGTSGAAASISVKDIDISTVTMTARGATSGDDVRNTIAAYISVVNQAIDKVTTAASTLGAVASRIEMQQSFVNTLMDTIDKGVGGLIDADMSEESTKLQALQVKQQLGVQALSIANQSAQNVLSLFRGG